MQISTFTEKFHLKNRFLLTFFRNSMHKLFGAKYFWNQFWAFMNFFEILSRMFWSANLFLVFSILLSYFYCGILNINFNNANSCCYICYIFSSFTCINSQKVTAGYSFPATSSHKFHKMSKREKCKTSRQFLSNTSLYRSE